MADTPQQPSNLELFVKIVEERLRSVGEKKVDNTKWFGLLVGLARQKTPSSAAFWQCDATMSADALRAVADQIPYDGSPLDFAEKLAHAFFEACARFTTA